MRLTLELVAQLTHKQCERYDPAKLGGLPPLRFVPDKPDESEGKKENTVTIKMDDHVQKIFCQFKSGNAERMIEVTRAHKSILSDRKLEERYNAAILLRDAAVNELAISLGDAAEKKIIQTRITKHEKTIRTNSPQVALDLFEKLLDTSNVSQWQSIVTNQCETIDYIALDGVRNTSGVARGRVFTSLEACYFAAILPVSSQDAAERLRRYLTTTVKMPDCITVEEFIIRIVELNDALPYLPCMKQQEGSPVGWIQSNEKYSDMELCQIVLSALPFTLQTAYWARQGSHFPIDLGQLKVDLKYLEIQDKQKKKTVEDLKRQLGSGTFQSNGANGKGKNTSGKGGGVRIPRTGKNGAGEATATAGPTSGHGKKNCTYCAKWSPAILHTHNTTECRKWTKDGKPKGKGGYQGNYANTGQSGDADFKTAFAQQTKEFNTLKKMMVKQTKAFKKQSKKRSRKGKDSDSDSSSDSDV